MNDLLLGDIARIRSPPFLVPNNNFRLQKSHFVIILLCFHLLQIEDENIEHRTCLHLLHNFYVFIFFRSSMFSSSDLLCYHLLQKLSSCNIVI
ncbi:hypothetical protein CEXT_456681 [Caerostris extrusa]|uniref:Uncharacterized protein n=1 Tax=Caerostris extrusa TaxID=172846 RepID=A0AAV4YC86_CAEEX|nr:hypothetical protein CEXT_456681 [Caerostris extrusa]